MSATTPLVERFTSGGALLASAVSGLTAEQERTRTGPGTWSIAELVTHLLDADLVLAERMKRVIAEDEPTLQAFDETAWVERLEAQAMPVEEAVSLFAANRAWMARILHRCSEADFARAGNHTEAGRKTLADLVTGAVSHLDHHLKFLYAKRANLGAAVPPRYANPYQTI